jgi:PPM family protein phosphatase
LTRDHSFVQDLLEKGVITSTEARTHRMRHVILRAVGTEESLVVDLLKGEAQTGDVFLLCSDGLTDMVDDEKIQQILVQPEALAIRAGMLVEAANAAGGHDNVTVVLCELIEQS